MVYRLTVFINMANNCYTIYKITGSQNAVKNLWDTLVSMDVNTNCVWLSDLAEHYGIDYENRQISVRGCIFCAEKPEKFSAPERDLSVLV